MNYVCEKVVQNVAQIKKTNIANDRSLYFVNPLTNNHKEYILYSR